jgi:hypothetical protein
METRDSWDTTDFLGERRPSRDQLFQTSTGIELDETLTEGEPLIRSPLNDVVGNIHHKYNGTALVWKLLRFAKGVILRPADKEWAGFDVHRETVFPCLATVFLELRVRSMLQDLLPTNPGCSMYKIIMKR